MACGTVYTGLRRFLPPSRCGTVSQTHWDTGIFGTTTHFLAKGAPRSAFMAFKFGFGYSKEKSRANAERFLQQNKLQNAIAEYEKILKAEPNDLTIANQIGDIYTRLGQNEKAIERFRSVADSYINEGATLKAIAMLKKIT